jgi:hypothetical protein
MKKLSILLVFVILLGCNKNEKTTSISVPTTSPVVKEKIETMGLYETLDSAMVASDYFFTLSNEKVYYPDHNVRFWKEGEKYLGQWDGISYERPNTNQKYRFEVSPTSSLISFESIHGKNRYITPQFKKFVEEELIKKIKETL